MLLSFSLARCASLLKGVGVVWSTENSLINAVHAFAGDHLGSLLVLADSVRYLSGCFACPRKIECSARTKRKPVTLTNQASQRVARPDDRLRLDALACLTRSLRRAVRLVIPVSEYRVGLGIPTQPDCILARPSSVLWDSPFEIFVVLAPRPLAVVDGALT